MNIFENKLVTAADTPVNFPSDQTLTSEYRDLIQRFYVNGINSIPKSSLLKHIWYVPGFVKFQKVAI